MQGEDSTFGKFKIGNVDIAIDDVAAIARRAGDRIMEIYNAPDFASKIKDPKADGSPLTQADLDANTIICTELKKLYPTIPIISEENANAPYSERKNWEVFWCVDPLDGTKEFVKRNNDFTVNIGLCVKGAPFAGVVYCPALDPPVIYKGVKNDGFPIKEECDAVGGAAGYDSFKTIQPKVFAEADPGLVVVASASHGSPETDAFIAQKFKGATRLERGSSLKLLMVAEGTAHVYPRLAPTSEWDTCAAQAIVECAGGQVLQVAGGAHACEPGTPVRYNKEQLLNPHFVVYGKVIERKAKAAKKEVAFGEAAASGPSPLLLGAAAVAAVAAAAYFAMAH